YAITSFIFGMDNDTPGVAERTLQQIRSWPPGLPVFGLLTPLPGTPLYKRLETEGRLTRPKHWQEFIPFAMAHTPLKMTIPKATPENNKGWGDPYSRQAIAKAGPSLEQPPVGYSSTILDPPLLLRGFYFPRLGRWARVKGITNNRRTIFKLVVEA